MESMNLLVQQMVQWETDIESELMVNQRISEKTKKDKLKLAERKREQVCFCFAMRSSAKQILLLEIVI